MGCCCTTKVCCGVLFGLSLGMVALGLVFAYAAFPAAIEMEVRKNLNLWNEKSEGRINFEEPPVPVYMKFNFFDCINADDVMANSSVKPEFNVRGPYAYRETRIKKNLTTESESEVYIKYGQYKAWNFDAEQSCGDCKESDEVTIVNAALLGLVDTFSNLPPLVGNPFLKRLNKAITGNDGKPDEHKDSLYLTEQVGNILFKGSKPGSINWLFDQIDLGLIPDNILNALLPPVISLDNGFAVFNGKNDTTDNEWYQVNTGRKDMGQYVEIEAWGPREGQLSGNLSGTPLGWTPNVGWMDGDEANTLRGTDGQQFHSDVKEDERVWIFQTDICRVMFAEYKEDVEIKGIPAKRFVVPYKALQANTKFNYGFCMEAERDLITWDDCVTEDSNDPELLDFSACDIPDYRCQDGIINLSKCQQAPVWMSSPHFYNSPDYIRDDFEGISEPTADEHETRIDIEPTSGVAIGLHKKIQINIPMETNDRIDYLKDVQEFRLFPILWLDEGADVDDVNAKKIKNMVVIPLTATVVVQWLFVGLGAAGVVVAIAYFLWRGMCMSDRRQYV